MTRKPKHRRRQTVSREVKLAFVKARPHMWNTPIFLAKEMMRAGLYAKSTGISYTRGPVERMVKKARVMRDQS